MQLEADKDAAYTKVVDIDLSRIVPLAAKPHSPDNIAVKSMKKLPVNQVCLGSCTNSSYKDLVTAAKILREKSLIRMSALFWRRAPDRFWKISPDKVTLPISLPLGRG